ncbi:hypothetical protein A0H76_716 [Hepatospora eriocheir]|uniref:Uncharacterized protein n=1 Tax=Hepatospora eriocheir TaxID=1081669 RepID=A0A1X0Q747_9MICR|nr:hypothetical protein A0H76_716 [Hepatospora eriocheir]
MSFLSNQLETSLEVCLGSLSCIKINYSKPISRADCLILLAKNCLYTATVIVSSIKTILPTPLYDIQPKPLLILHHVSQLELYFQVCNDLLKNIRHT